MIYSSAIYRARFLYQIVLVVFAVNFVSFCSTTSSPALALDNESELREVRAYEALTKGRALSRQGDYSRALALLRSVGDCDPCKYSVLIHFECAVALLQSGKPADALKECDIALRYDPDNVDVKYWKAYSLLNLNKPDKARVIFLELTELSVDAPIRKLASEGLDRATSRVVMNRARKLRKEHKYREAIALLDSAIADGIKTHRDSLYLLLSSLLESSGNYERSIEAAEKALSINPSLADAMYSIAICHERKGRIEMAITWLDKYLACESDKDKHAYASAVRRGLIEDRKLAKDPSLRKDDYLDEMTDKEQRGFWSPARMPLKVFIPKSSSAKGYQSVMPALIQKAFDTWRDASGDKLSYVLVNDKDKSDIEIRWTDKALDSSTAQKKGMSTKTTGLTKLSTVASSSSPSIEHATIWILTVDPFQYPEIPVKPGQCATVCMHEVGHALGLGHSKSMNDLMYYRSTQTRSCQPTARDKATLARLYTGHPAIAAGSQSQAPPISIVYLPPPYFQPPKLPSDAELMPPLFQPPPLPGRKIPPPPLFKPPPLDQVNKSSVNAQSKKSSNVPKVEANQAGKSDKADKRFFMPLPAK